MEPTNRRGIRGGFSSRRALTPTGSEPDSLHEAKADAGSAGLRYSSDSSPGILRRGVVGQFEYTYPDGRPVTDEATLSRIRKMVLPPAWTDVWIAPIANAHLQATARDARGRKQYRYHAKWRALRDESKFAGMLEFGAALPTLREHVERDLGRPGLPREKVLATVVRLLEVTFIRVGNEEYAKANHSYGLTTLRNRHVSVNGSELTFEFRGKSGKQHSIDLRDRRVAQIVRRCKELPGAELFQYLDESGARHSIGSHDVNDYLRQLSGADFTAKDFRTWAGSVAALDALLECPPCAGESELKKTLAEVVNNVANGSAIPQRCAESITFIRRCSQRLAATGWPRCARGPRRRATPPAPNLPLWNS